jgi:transposase
MPRALTFEQRENIISMLKRGCGLREICRSLHVSLGSVHNIQRAYVPDAKLGHRGRPPVMTRAMERFCISEVIRGKIGTATDACRQLKKDFGVQVSANTVRRALCRHGLRAQVKKKKPQLSRKNIKDRLEFAIAHQHWTINDWSRVIFSDESKINRFCSDGMSWCWIHDSEQLSS